MEKQLGVILLVGNILLWLTIIFNVPFVRQLIGYVYLTFVPGLIILSIFKIRLKLGEACVFVVGLSIAFLMIIGFFINMLSPIIGIQNPHSALSYLIILTLVLSSFLFLLRPSKTASHKEFPIQLNHKLNLKPTTLSVSCLILSVAGAFSVNTLWSNNVVTLLMFICIAVSIIATLISSDPSQLDYVIIILGVTSAILFHVTLFSNLLHGTGDIFSEYQVFKMTINNSWNPAISNRLNTMLSVTLLPTIYSTILNIDGTKIFKIAFPLIFSFVPLGLFQLTASKFGKATSLLSIFFFISNNVFYMEVAVLERQMIGELFYILLFLTIFSANMKGKERWLCFTLFSFGLVSSHYSLAYIFLGFISSAYIFNFFLNRDKKEITMSMVLLFASLVFAWYIYSTSSVTFIDLVQNADYIANNFISDFLNPQSRTGSVLQATGFQGGIDTLWHNLGRYVFYIMEFLVLVGFTSKILKQRFLFFRDQYNLLAAFNMVLLLACIAVPNLAGTFNISRFFHITLFFLSPFCIQGGVALTRLFIKNSNLKRKRLILATIFLMLFFFFQTGFVYEIAGDESWSLPLSGYRLDKERLDHGGFTLESELSGALWLSRYQNPNTLVFCHIRDHILFIYGNDKVNPSILFINRTTISKGAYVYLRDYIENEFNLTETILDLNDVNCIFSTGRSRIYSSP